MVKIQQGPNVQNEECKVQKDSFQKSRFKKEESQEMEFEKLQGYYRRSVKNIRTGEVTIPSCYSCVDYSGVIIGDDQKRIYHRDSKTQAAEQIRTVGVMQYRLGQNVKLTDIQ